ncbi:MAG: M48 family metalloprotease [Nitrospira sp.]|nr:MAG: tetratricopeptide repeat protein [Nitrospira sp.]
MRVLQFVIITSVWFLTGCGTTPFGTSSDNTLDEDERRLWAAVTEEEKRIDQSGLLYADSAVNDYLISVMHKLSPPGLTPDLLAIEVRVLKNPLLNAFAFPNGKIYVHTGMLARIENEAQLATLLGHELTHATHRHTIEELRGVRRATTALATLHMIALPFGVFGLAATTLGTIGTLGSVTGYSRGKEQEADEEGIRLMVKAGYSPQEAPKLFEHLKEEIGFRKVKEPYFFGSHPKIQDRIDSFRDLLKSKYADQRGEIGADRYDAVMTPLVIDNAETDLAIGRFQLAQRDLERILSKQSRHARAHYLLGEVCRQRKGEGDAELSEKHYRQAITVDPQLPAPHRALGYALLKRGDHQNAKAELLKYLELAPQASDRAYVEQALKESP